MPQTGKDLGGAKGYLDPEAQGVPTETSKLRRWLARKGVNRDYVHNILLERATFC